MAILSWCVLVLLVIGCQVHNAASALTVTSTPTAGSIAENVAVGMAVVTVSSAGTDITYSLESQAPNTDPKIFAISETSGVVTVSNTTHLDFEKEDDYTLVIKATQTSGGTDSGTVSVTVTVTDVDKAPTFAEDRYTACVNKSSPGGTVVIQVTATDEDDDDIITYSITDIPIFEVEPTAGTIKVKSDQTVGETLASYNLTLTATDNDTPPLSGTTTVSIKVGNPCPGTTPLPATTPPKGDNTTLPGVTPAPNFATTLTASFCLFLVSVAVHLLRIW